ncbi:BQ5605_C019g08840 [Microbotryum silenes-dioicae]|uniref:BQ5605_C019g08840 protein n=1 Tax=Microbotryum silenes-dioicae TaxID=796604 RepID=A0A2X0LW01_9BASI|nr:BQ5605_C019g08840 [Microbotryum silenes-dioicae]
MAPVSLPLFSFRPGLCRLSSVFWPDARTCPQLAGPARLSLSCSSNFLVWSPLVRRSETYHCLSSNFLVWSPLVRRSETYHCLSRCVKQLLGLVSFGPSIRDLPLLEQVCALLNIIETCRVATISDCWQTGFGELSAVLSVLLDVDVYTAGFPSFLSYKCLPSSGITAVSLLTSVFGSSAGRTVQLEEKPIALLSSPAAKRGSVFSRSTAVFHLTRPSLQRESGGPGGSLGFSFVFKMKFVSPSTAKVELDMLEQITQAVDGGMLPPTVAKHLALFELAASLSQYQSQVEDTRLPPPPPAPEEFFQLVWPPPRGLFRRTLELLVLRNPTPLPAPLVDTAQPGEATTLSIRHSLQVFDQRLAVLATLAEYHFHHRDLSVGHILHYQAHLVLVDWSAGIVARLSASESVRLNWNTDPELRPLPRYKLGHVLESTIYCFVNVLSYRIAPQEDIWRFLRHQHQPDEVEHPTDYCHLRGVIWKCSPSEVFFQFEKREELLAAIRSEDAELGDLVDDVTNEWPLWVTDDDGSKALWAAVQAKLYFLSMKRSGTLLLPYGTINQWDPVELTGG